MRALRQHYLFPDFVVCIAYSAGDDALLRLIETKHNTKDATRNRDGSVGEIVDTDDLAAVQDWLRQTRPTV